MNFIALSYNLSSFHKVLKPLQRFYQSYLLHLILLCWKSSNQTLIICSIIIKSCYTVLVCWRITLLRKWGVLFDYVIASLFYKYITRVTRVIQFDNVWMSQEGSSHDRGLYVRCFEELFDLSNSENTSVSRFSFTVTVVELHNEQVCACAYVVYSSFELFVRAFTRLNPFLVFIVIIGEGFACSIWKEFTESTHGITRFIYRTCVRESW